MLPVAKIVAENVTRLIDQLQDRPDREVLAKRMGMSGKTLGNMRAGSGNPTVKNVAAAAKYLKVQPWELLHPDGPGASQSARFNPVMLAESIEALRRVAKDAGAAYDPVTHPSETIYAYELRLQLGVSPTTAEVIDFGAKLAERLRAARG